MCTQLCRRLSACRILLACLVALLVGAGSASALTVSTNKPKIGEAIRVLDPVAGRSYSVFWINLDGPKADPCASISGSQLLEDSDLTHYGTCFVDDDGTFQIVELSEELVANYNDSIQHPSYIAKQSIVVKGWLFEFLVAAQSVSVPRGQSGNASLTATLSTGVPNPVTFDLIGLPDGVRASVNPISCTPTCGATIAFSVAESAIVGSYPVTVVSSGNGAPSQSTSLTLTVLAGGVTSFRIEAGAGGDIGTQKAGKAFPIRITAQNFDYSDNTAFSGTVDLSTTAGAVTPQVSGPFVNGVRTENVTVTVSGSGKTISARQTGGTASGTSNAFTVLDGGPVTTIVSYPASPSNNRSPSFTFTTSDIGVTFECKLDASAWAPCTSPVTYNNVADGTHTFQVRGTSGGYTEAAPPSVTWLLDATAPDTVFDSVPTASTYVTSAMFLFSSTEASSTFECRMDAAAFSACVSPVTIGTVAFGSHTFEVRAIDPARNVDASPARHAWTVERRLLTITATSRSKVYGDGVTFNGSEFTVVGLQTGDSVALVSLASTGAAASAAAGTYAIVPSAAQGSGLSNYVITYVNGTLTVGKASSTTTIRCADAAFTGAAVESCSATVTGIGGLNQALPVTYTNNTNAGTASASASFAGNDNYGSSNASATFVIGKAASVTTVRCVDATFTGAAIESCSATVTGVGGLSQPVPVTYARNTNVGTATANASFAGDSNYASSTGSATFLIGKAASVTTVRCADATYTGAAIESCTASVAGIGGLNQVLGVSYANNRDAGTATANASFAGDSNYAGSNASATFVIGKAASTTTVRCADATYTGAAIESCTASVTGNGGLTQSLPVTYANNRDLGTATGSASFAGDGNYTSSTASATFVIGPGAAHHLAFGVQPSSISAGSTMNPAVTVRVLDAFNNLVVNDNSTTVTLAIAANPGGATLSNGNSRVVVNGVAVFNGLSLEKAGANYTLAASSANAPSLIAATSTPFAVAPGAPHHLAFGVQPTSIMAGAAMNPSITVRVLDAFNNLVTGDNSTAVSLAIASNPGAAVLTNGNARAAVNGIATFAGVSLDKAGANYTLTATSAPVLIADTSAPFTITANLTLGVSVSAMSFGNVPIATPSTTRTVTLSNPSTTVVPITAITTGSSEFAVTGNTCGTSVPAKVGTTNGTCSLTVTMTPAEVGPRTGTLQVISSLAGAPPVSLSGNGTFALATSVSAADFGNVPVATTSVLRTVTLTNVNGVAVPLTSVAIDNNEFVIASNTCGASVPAKSGATHGSCTLTVNLTPVAPAARTGKLTITSGATNTPVVSLAGTGTLALATSVSAVDFGNVPVGTASLARTVTLTNVNGVAIPLTSVATGNAEFAVTSNTCGSSVPAKTGTTNGSCTLTLKLTPAAIGTRSGTLSFVSGATNAPTVSLVGSGIAATP